MWITTIDTNKIFPWEKQYRNLEGETFFLNMKKTEVDSCYNRNIFFHADSYQWLFSPSPSAVCIQLWIIALYWDCKFWGFSYFLVYVYTAPRRNESWTTTIAVMNNDKLVNLQVHFLCSEDGENALTANCWGFYPLPFKYIFLTSII